MRAGGEGGSTLKLQAKHFKAPELSDAPGLECEDYTSHLPASGQYLLRTLILTRYFQISPKYRENGTILRQFRHNYSKLHSVHVQPWRFSRAEIPRVSLNLGRAKIKSAPGAVCLEALKIQVYQHLNACKH